VRSHRYQLANRDDARATDARDEEIVSVLNVTNFRIGKALDCLLEFNAGIDTFTGPQLATLHGDEAWTEAVNTGVILVAGILVDLALATERRFLRHNGQAVRLNRTITAAFTNEVVNDDKLVGFNDLALLATTTLLERTGLGIILPQDL